MVREILLHRARRTSLERGDQRTNRDRRREELDQAGRNTSHILRAFVHHGLVLLLVLRGSTSQRTRKARPQPSSDVRDTFLGRLDTSTERRAEHARLLGRLLSLSASLSLMLCWSLLFTSLEPLTHPVIELLLLP